MLVVDEPSVERDLRIEIRGGGFSAVEAAEDLRRLQVCLLEKSRLFCFKGNVARVEERHLLALYDPLTERLSAADLAGTGGAYLDVFCLPGVTDAEGETAALAMALVGLPGMTCRAGHRYRFADPVPAHIRPSVERALGNLLIHRFLWGDDSPSISHAPEAATQPLASLVPLRGCQDAELLRLSRDHSLALDLHEMRAIAAYFEGLGRDPTDVELQSLALAWSEHCSHKTFKAVIELERDGRRETVDGLLHHCIVRPSRSLDRPWVRSAFEDNAGIIAFDRRHDLAFKVETHNHPSALEPYGGAHTGVGGVIRDILGVSAEPIAGTDVLCFGPLDLPEDAVPDDVFHPRATFRGVVRGVADYGNNMGIPTVAGAVLFHPGYTANPLVHCGTIGLLPRGRHPRAPRPGDTVVLLGGRTGRDGLHGATMSSASLDREAVAGSAVQIGNPITEKVVRDVLPHLRDEALYHAITDCGAGGLCSAVGEMGAELGVEVDLALVPLKYPGLRPWEIWLSEAQERMVLAVPPAHLPRVFQLCRAYDVEATVLGAFRSDRQLVLRYGESRVAQLDLRFMHGGSPRRTLHARWKDPEPAIYASGEPERLADALLDLLAHPNIAGKESVIRRYDHEVGAGTLFKPMVGSGPSDAAVLRPLPGSSRGLAVAHGINPLYGRLDPHAMATLAVDEALRNLVAVGGSIDRAALLDNFSWGDVDDPAELGALTRAAQGCRDAVLAYGVPFISGKDSLRNTSVGRSGARSGIPGTLLISAIGLLPDVRKVVTSALKDPGNTVYLLGWTRDELGGSHYLWTQGWTGGAVPRSRPDETVRLMRRLTRAIRRGLVRSCHDLSEGGLAVAAAEMCIAAGLGIVLELSEVPRDTEAAEAVLFGESPGRFLVEVAEEQRDDFEQLFAGLPCGPIGRVRADARFEVRREGRTLADLATHELEAAWSSLTLPEDRTERGPGEEGPPRAETSGGEMSPPPVPQRRSAARALVLAAPGVNCDRETVEACRRAGFRAELVHLNQLLRGERRLADFGFLVLPGGFSYGDHLGAGAMLATVLRHRLLDDLQRFAGEGRPVLGICNGFQVLARLGLLGDVALAANSTGRFECRWVGLEVEPSRCLFLRELDRLELPIAHGEGRVVLAGEAVTGTAPLRYARNPNGSDQSVAGVCSPAGNVFGLMPHPERYLDRFHHPDWQRGCPLPPPGLVLFQNALRALREAV